MRSPACTSHSQVTSIAPGFARVNYRTINATYPEVSRYVTLCHVTDEERQKARANLGPWLRDLRNKTGQSQDALAQALGTDRRKIIRWEKGESEPEGLALLAYLEAVGVQVTPAPPASVPRAVNAELRALRAEVAALRGLLLESTPKTRRGTEAYFREFQRLLRERNELMAEEPAQDEQLKETG